MSNAQEKTLDGESDQQERNSVYDFLYHDARRIGSFLAQFDPHGQLQSLTKTNAVSDTAGSTVGVTAGASIPAIVKVDTVGNQQVSQTASDAIAKTYDPLWQNSIALLDYLTARGLIERNILQARIGQFVLVSGKLSIIDMGLLKSIFSSKFLKQNLSKQISKATNKQSGTSGSNFGDVGIELLSILPYAIQMRFGGSGFGIWSTLRTEGLSLSTDDLLLKHGSSVAGTWNLFGILDALPDSGSEEQGSSVIGDEGMLTAMANLGASFRPLVGRPNHAFGMTPLLIFREIFGSQLE